MKIINPSIENITPDSYNLESVYKHIELCGRTCYKSHDKITEESYKKFYSNLKNSKHYSVFEHGTVYLFIKVNPYEVPSGLYNGWLTESSIVDKYIQNPYSKVVDAGLDDNKRDDGSYHDLIGGNANGETQYCITTNMRVIIENGWEDDLKYICEPTEYHEKRYTFKVVCDRAVSHEIVRHRTLSFSQESQRYCNYSKNKYNNEVTFVKPHWYNGEIGTIKHKCSTTDDWGSLMCEYYYSTTPEANYQATIERNYLYALEAAENLYLSLLDKGVKPQDARSVLPNSCKTELVVTGFESDWKHFLSLRSSKADATGVHPDMEYIANLIYDKYIIFK